MSSPTQDTALPHRTVDTMTDRAFGWDVISEQSANDLTPLVREAVHYYLADRASGRLGWRYPRFRSTAGDNPLPILDDLPPAISDELQIALAHEADRQGVEPGRLLRHALLYYLAELDSGRIAGRIADELG